MFRLQFCKKYYYLINRWDAEQELEKGRDSGDNFLSEKTVKPSGENLSCMG